VRAGRADPPHRPDRHAAVGGGGRCGGWTITPDDGPLGGSTTDCKGEDYDWPDLEILAGGSQFLDREGESVALVVEKVDGDAADDVEALRGALDPCSPASTTAEHGAMITPVGEDSFAYQTPGDDGLADYLSYTMVIACGPYHLEALAYDYSEQFDQQQFEDLIAPALERVLDAGDCQVSL